MAVTMDENTANKYLSVTNGKQVKVNPTASDKPFSLDRFDMKPCVLSRQAYNSGIIKVEVDVDKINMWRVGVVTKSAKRHGFTMMQPSNYYWVVEWNGRELVALDYTQKVIHKKFIRTLVMYLDVDNKKVTFDVDDNVNVYTFDRMAFSEPLYILFSTTDENNQLTIK
ncbi:butyrophilin subfamily 2 member A2-like [Polyodon spathula]|uniref:butyrophilin subfamily 2 member A2-like n=1 Tax=Polyodon spathula TaxID=7913 RepID=UPI001B7E11B4|nr:butyrophilin subfamily 2 member A2-like [Polyodon spathula]